ncbi:DUF6607 family protein [Maricaulis sp.]|jgi:hypothetical protein|uniref:DUF6607 family protein n=1 Tax=Maricaulis sp. TaxID=1486257 RepID=UPI00261D9245|nr:DUF6607 family protein [Maricaulis sp.]
MKIAYFAAAALALAGCATTSQTAPVAEAPAASVQERSQALFEQDRQAILAMQGEYAVTFDFRETVPIAEGYELAEPKFTPAREVVIVVEDTGDFIMLQHLLIVGEADNPFIVKHWRQDWRYEPDAVLAFQGHDDWTVEEVPAADAAGAWSQTVYQVDDSPRYAAVAQWEHDAEGISTWEPPVSWRPLPRRDDTTRDDYDAIAAVNRHTITPWGWTHEQDNSKIVVEEDGSVRELVREIGINTYRNSDLSNDQAAHDYWEATHEYWALVRERFDWLEANTGRFHIEDDAEGTLLYGPVLEAGQRVLFGMATVEEAFAEAETYLDSQITVIE